jgi:hypothetical protein
MSLMSRVMSLNVSLIVNKVISCAACVELSAMYVLGRCKDIHDFLLRNFTILYVRVCVLLITGPRQQTGRQRDEVM